jgi:hypothetical protein
MSGNDQRRPGGGGAADSFGELTTATDTRSAPLAQLSDLAQAIDREHQAAIGAARSAVEHAITCGQLLLQAKAEVGHGGWLPWLEANTTVSARQSQRYMRLSRAAADGKCDATSFLTIEGALAAIAAPRDEPESAGPPVPVDEYLAKQERAARTDGLSPQPPQRLPASLGAFIVLKLKEIDPRIRLHRTGLDLPDDLTLDQWLAIGSVLPRPPEGAFR